MNLFSTLKKYKYVLLLFALQSILLYVIIKNSIEKHVQTLVLTQEPLQLDNSKIQELIKNSIDNSKIQELIKNSIDSSKTQEIIKNSLDNHYQPRNLTEEHINLYNLHAQKNT